MTTPRPAHGWALLLAACCAAAASAQQPAEPPADIFAKVPPVQPLQRPGYFTVPPTGQGHYSARDCLLGEWRAGPPKYPYPRFGIMPHSFFDVDWRYLDKPDNAEHDLFDCLKRQRLCDDTFLFTAGGEVRYRFNHESNSRLLNTGPHAGRTNTYGLLRTRVYGDLMYKDQVRLFVESIDAQGFHFDLPPLPADRDRSDLQNLFLDLRTVEINGRPVWLRAGRQELLYGSQRAVSPPDWNNNRRTFQGVKGFWQGEKLAVDAFCVQPVVPDAARFNSVDNNAIFAGVWTTYRPDANRAVDWYYLYLDRAGRAANVRGRNDEPGGTNPSTFGARHFGDRDGWLWDFEGMVQFGEHANQALFAQALTVSGGYRFKDAAMTPMLWLGWDWASGDPSPGTGGVRRTYEQLFPFGHYYFGFIDVVGRRNIHDLTAQLTLWPTKWVTTQVQSHTFFLARRRDALYNATGAPIRRDPTGRAGAFVGHEIDVLLNFHLSKHADILVSYSHLFAGGFVRNTATTPAGRQSPDSLYLQYGYRW